MCFGGRIYCPQCPTNKWFYDWDELPEVFSEKWPVPLIAAHGQVKIQDFAAEVTVEQRFENKETQPLEIQYQFQLDPAASVVRFEAHIDGRRVVGELKEKEQARNTYDDAIASGHGAYLLEQKKNKDFVANVGNLPPGKEVIITLVYVLELQFNEEGLLKLELLEQGYAPDGVNSLTFPNPSTLDASENSKRIPDGLSFDIELDMSAKITQIHSPSHKETTNVAIDSTDPRRARVTVPPTIVPLKENFELFIQLDASNDLTARVQQNAKGEKIAMVAFTPQLADVEPLGEIVFLIDRSGSMMGPRLYKAKEALQIFLRSLSAGVKFNIVSFGSSFSQIFPESKFYSADSLAAASAHVKAMSANMGGTEILSPLKAIFNKAPQPRYPRQLFILTDGEVSNPDDCILACKSGAGTTRTFCFGIGDGASQKLVEGMARAGNGNHVMIGNSERIDDKVLEQLGAALLPAVSNIAINWSGASQKVSPSFFGPSFGYKPIVSFAWIKPDVKETELPVRFQATTPLQDFDMPKNVSLSNVTSGTFLFALAAKRLFNEFEHGTSFAHDPQTGKLRTGWDENKIKEAMIELSLQTGVLCKHTAFVAVEERKDPTNDSMVLREILKTKTGKIEAKNQGLLANFIEYGDSGSEDESASSDDEADGFSSPTNGSVVRSSSLSKKRNLLMSFGASSGSDSDGNDDGDADLRKEKEEEKQVERQKKWKFEKEDRSRAEGSHRLAKAAQAPLMHKKGAATASSTLSSSLASTSSVARTATVPDAVLARMREIILKQTAEGSWSLTDVVSIHPLDKVKAALSAAAPAELAQNSALAELLFATALVCAYFEEKIAAEKRTWQLVVKKARSWINKNKFGSVDWNAVTKTLIQSI